MNGDEEALNTIKPIRRHALAAPSRARLPRPAKTTMSETMALSERDWKAVDIQAGRLHLAETQRLVGAYKDLPMDSMEDLSARRKAHKEIMRRLHIQRFSKGRPVEEF